MTTTTNSRSGEKGFTLVELSIVMIIIGLLIGGILKGQELIANARLASAVSKVKAIDAAMNTFRDSYAGLPGDINNAQTRLPGCAATTKCGAIAANTAGLGNNVIGAATNGSGSAQGAASENIVSWAQLAATDLVGGVRNGVAADVVASGTTVPSAEIPGQIFIGYENGTTAPLIFPGTAAPIPRAGHYLLIHNGAPSGASVAASATTVSLTPGSASRIDNKMDDGLPNTGSVVAMGTSNATTGCVANGASGAATGIDAIYATALTGNNCGVYIRVQQ